MKKTLAVLPTLALCMCLAACGHFVNIMPGTEAGSAAYIGTVPEAVDSFKEQPLLSFMGLGEFSSSYYQDTPVALSVRTPEQGYASPIFDRASIIAACDCLRTMRVTGQADPAQTAGAQQVSYIFTMDDGQRISVTFEGGLLALDSGRYTVSGGETLSTLTFPGYSGDWDIFDLYYDEDIRAFADNFASATPASVGRRSNGGATLTSEDPAVVSQVFGLLQNARVARVEEDPDQNIDLTQTTDYIFTLSGGVYYTFSFTGPCLTVTPSADYGPVYYWLDGIDELANVTILPQSTVPTFAGGPITGLRDDIAQARAAAYGELPGISVVGVYVDYTINGQSGYLTLEGDTAVSFVQQVTGISANAETTEPGAEQITVFVTLSDQSGPIIVFNGDTVQQLVGVNHACDVNAMANLRYLIGQLALDERNIGQIAEGATN